MKFSGCLSLSDLVRSKPFRNPWTSAASVCIDTGEEEKQKSGLRKRPVNDERKERTLFPTSNRNPRLFTYGQGTYVAETELITLSQTGCSSSNSRNVNLEPSHNTQISTNNGRQKQMYKQNSNHQVDEIRLSVSDHAKSRSYGWLTCCCSVNIQIVCKVLKIRELSSHNIHNVT